jgi:hypothetical protein
VRIIGDYDSVNFGLYPCANGIKLYYHSNNILQIPHSLKKHLGFFESNYYHPVFSKPQNLDIGRPKQKRRHSLGQHHF